MDTERNDGIVQLVQAALDLPPAERAAFLAEQCNGDDALRREVETLLLHDGEVSGFLDQPAFEIIAKDMAATASLTGRIIGHYQLIAELGRGGMGEVWLAEDKRLQRKVAIKFLPQLFTTNPEHVRRFTQEARAASALNHPNIITIHEIDEHNGLHFIVMEYVIGQTLRMRLQAGKLTHDETIDIAAQIADALAAAHQVGIIHRDIKPENVMLRSSDGKVKVLDFGIAKLAEEGIGERGMVGGKESGNDTSALRNSPTADYAAAFTHPVSTVIGSLIGTVNYMSPEQARGESLHGQSDIFSLGQMLLEMVTGKHLFAGKTKDDVLTLLRGKQEPVAESYKFEGVPTKLERMIRQSLKRDFTQRYATAQEMQVALKTLQRRTATKWWRWSVIGAVIGVVALFVALVCAAWFSVKETWSEQILRDGHTSMVKRAIFFPDGKRLVSVSEDKQIIVWDFVQRKRIKTLTAHTGWVNSVDFSPDGKYFATGSSDKTVIVWDAEKLEPLLTLNQHQTSIQSIAFSPNGKLLAASSIAETGNQGKARTILWNVSDWKMVREFPQAGLLLFSPDSELLKTAYTQWEVSSGRCMAGQDEVPQWNWCDFSPDGKSLIGITTGGDVGKQVFALPGRFANYKSDQRYPAHQDFGRAVAYSPDGKLVATGTDNIVIWDAETMQIQGRFEYQSSVWSLDFSPDGRWLVSSHGDGSIMVWDMQLRRREYSFNAHADSLRAVAVSPNGKQYATAGDDRAVIIWNAETGTKEAALQGHDNRVVNVVFAPNGKWLASLSQNGILIRWDLERQRAEWEVNVRTGSPALAVSPDGKWLATQRTLTNSEDGKAIFLLGKRDNLPPWLSAADFTPQGNYLVAASGNLAVLIDTQNWRILSQQEDGNVYIDVITVSPDGKKFATGRPDGSIELWEVNPLRKLGLLGKHVGRVGTVRFAPDGQTVVSVSGDKTIKLWDVNGWNQPQTIGTHAVPVAAIAFSPDGKRLLSGEQDRTVRVYTRHWELWGRESEWLDLFF